MAEIDSSRAIAWFVFPRAEQAQHLDLALGQAGGARAVDALLVARRVQDRLGRLRVEPAVGDLALEHVSCCRRRRGRDGAAAARRSPS